MNQRIDARIAALEAELNDLKTMVTTESEGGPAKSDRRGMVKLLAAGAVGAVTGAALLGAQPAAAADNNAVLQGGDKEATNATILNASASSALILGGGGGVGVIADGNFGNAWFPSGGDSPQGTDGV